MLSGYVPAIDVALSLILKVFVRFGVQKPLR
jgi:hypothetical protein